MYRRLALVTLLSLPMFGCSSSSETTDGVPSHSTFTDDSGAAEPEHDAGAQADFVEGGAADDAGAPKVLFYANTDDTLYSLDPNDLTAPLVTVGKFDCVGTANGTSVMTDIAVSKTGKIYGVSAAAAWPITLQPNGVVHCDAKWSLPYDTHFNGLTFAPENTVQAAEALIAANANGELYQIDPQTGGTTQVGTLGTDTTTGKPWSLSGDMVFLANNGNPIGFATVRTCSSPTSCVGTDTLAEIDVSAIHAGTQSVLKVVRGPVKRGAWCQNAASPTTFGSMFGIVAWEDRVYGFSRKGDVVEIHNDDGSGCLVAPYASLAFAGAGINTLAPVVAPPPK